MQDVTKIMLEDECTQIARLWALSPEEYNEYGKTVSSYCICPVTKFKFFNEYSAHLKNGKWTKAQEMNGELWSNFPPCKERVMIKFINKKEFMHTHTVIYNAVVGGFEELNEFYLAEIPATLAKAGEIAKDCYTLDVDREKLIPLENGKYLYNWFGKYSPELSFILKDVKDLNFKISSFSQFALENRGKKIEILEGSFFISKKEKNCFEVIPEGKHRLLKITWGGAESYATYGKYDFIRKEVIYYKYSPSNAGGFGYTWIIVPKEWQYSNGIK